MIALSSSCSFLSKPGPFLSLGRKNTPPRGVEMGRAARVRASAVTAAPPAQTMYEVLAVPETARLEEIKAAYRRAALRWHPDTCRSGDEQLWTEQFVRARQAYEVLSDTARREGYDLALRAGCDVTGFKNITGGGGRGGFADWEAQLAGLQWRGVARAAAGEETWGSRMRRAHARSQPSD